MILEYDKDSLGSKGKKYGSPISTTKILVRCDINNCQESWWTIWRYRKERDIDMCICHKNELGVCGMKDKNHTKETKEKIKEKNKK